MLLYVVTYDIPCNRRRKRVSDLLEGYGKRVQYSVFECVLSEVKFQELKKRLEGRVKLPDDSVRLYPLSKHTVFQVQVLGGVPVTQFPSSVII